MVTWNGNAVETPVLSQSEHKVQSGNSSAVYAMTNTTHPILWYENE